MPRQAAAAAGCGSLLHYQQVRRVLFLCCGGGAGRDLAGLHRTGSLPRAKIILTTRWLARFPDHLFSPMRPGRCRQAWSMPQNGSPQKVAAARVDRRRGNRLSGGSRLTLGSQAEKVFQPYIHICRARYMGQAGVQKVVNRVRVSRKWIIIHCAARKEKHSNNPTFTTNTSLSSSLK